MPKTVNIFICELCDFKGSKKSNLDTHFFTAKHKNKLELNELNNKNASFLEYTCRYCKKKYKARNSLWYHEQKCVDQVTTLPDSSNNEIKVLTTLVLELVKSNNDLQKQMMEVCKNNSNNNNVINSHNKTFNLQLFLNEECKDAMNMSEFIKSIDLQLIDLEKFAELDYTEGMSNLIINQLKNTDMNKRPVHCSDGKRETLYIKEENKWEKEGPENKKMIGAVRAVDKKNIDLLFKWKDQYPTCLNTDSQYNDQYIKLLRSVISGSEENVNKVIKKVSKEVVIDK